MEVRVYVWIFLIYATAKNTAAEIVSCSILNGNSSDPCCQINCLNTAENKTCQNCPGNMFILSTNNYTSTCNEFSFSIGGNENMKVCTKVCPDNFAKISVNDIGLCVECEELCSTSFGFEYAFEKCHCGGSSSYSKTSTTTKTEMTTRSWLWSNTADLPYNLYILTGSAAVVIFAVLASFICCCRVWCNLHDKYKNKVKLLLDNHQHPGYMNSENKLTCFRHFESLERANCESKENDYAEIGKEPHAHQNVYMTDDLKGQYNTINEAPPMIPPQAPADDCKGYIPFVPSSKDIKDMSSQNKNPSEIWDGQGAIQKNFKIGNTPLTAGGGNVGHTPTEDTCAEKIDMYSVSVIVKERHWNKDGKTDNMIKDFPHAEENGYIPLSLTRKKPNTIYSNAGSKTNKMESFGVGDIQMQEFKVPNLPSGDNLHNQWSEEKGYLPFVPHVKESKNVTTTLSLNATRLPTIGMIKDGKNQQMSTDRGYTIDNKLNNEYMVPDAHYTEAVSGSHYSEAVSGSHYSEAVSGSHYTEAVSATHYTEAASGKMKGTLTNDNNLPTSNIYDDPIVLREKASDILEPAEYATVDELQLDKVSEETDEKFSEKDKSPFSPQSLMARCLTEKRKNTSKLTTESEVTKTILDMPPSQPQAILRQAKDNGVPKSNLRKSKSFDNLPPIKQPLYDNLCV